MGYKQEKLEYLYADEDLVEKVNDNMPDDEEIYFLAELYKVFADPTRIKIMYVLTKGEMCVRDIAQILNMTQSSISHQLRVLKQSRLVKFKREGKVIFYSLADEHVYTILNQGFEHIAE
ncbi:ArsR/SmtB family transcription factor [Anaerosacchariphilus polymeriproducens]|uniref:Transcriptional regulator n=1 Tax=Anaerosacchariphilus polymeriproducens TaxID=1812858 RepID=A0A371AUU5_9FIRM|nr:metalloregulator ArsR/SmtB family transcription factor [Anaerosacchariphilus polymeriproducens]RDU23346.1 transcriptional regulator [Anaerosacchariphilus polymeriproducens]